MKNWFKLAFVVLLIATIVWGILFYLILQEYCEFVEGLSELERMWGLWDPWWRWNGMPYVIVAGIGLLCAWVFLIASYLSSAESKRKAHTKQAIVFFVGLSKEQYPKTDISKELL